MYYLATKSELTSIADGIREVTGKSGKISYPFIEAIDNIQTLNLDSYDTLIGFTYNSSAPTAGNGMENLPESTYVTFISDPYVTNIIKVSGVSNFEFQNLSMRDRFELQGITFNRASNIIGELSNGVIAYSSYFSYVKEIILPVCTKIGYKAFKNGIFSYINLPLVSEVEQDGFCSCYNLEKIVLNNCKILGESAFQKCYKLKDISIPNCTNISSFCFSDCTLLSDVYLPVCQNVGKNAFQSCQYLERIELPECTAIESGAFRYCLKLETAIFPKLREVKQLFYGAAILKSVYLFNCEKIDGNAFIGARDTRPFLGSMGGLYGTISIYISTSTVPTLESPNAFPSNTKIHIPESLYNTYLLDTNWNQLSSQIVSTKNF